MKTTIVFPDNSVEVDGNSVEWSAAEFAEMGIPLVRVKEILVQGGYAESLMVDGRRLLVFPTKEVAVFEVRANAEGLETPRKLKVRMPKKSRRGPGVRREHEIRDGELFLRCQGSSSCGQMLPADAFYKIKTGTFGRMYLCKNDWNKYLRDRKDKQLSTEST